MGGQVCLKSAKIPQNFKEISSWGQSAPSALPCVRACIHLERQSDLLPLLVFWHVVHTYVLAADETQHRLFSHGRKKGRGIARTAHHDDATPEMRHAVTTELARRATRNRPKVAVTVPRSRRVLRSAQRSVSRQLRTSRRPRRLR